MKKSKMRLKRLLDIRKKQNAVKCVQLNNNKRNSNGTVHVRQQFVNMIIKNNDAAPQARHYTIEEKLFCLSLYRKSRSSYTFLFKYLLCSSVNTLNKQLKKIPFYTGCNSILLKYLKLTAKEINVKDLNILIIWDVSTPYYFVYFNY